MPRLEKRVILLLAVCCIALGGVLGVLGYSLSTSLCEHSYHFINADAVCGSKVVLGKKSYRSTEDALTSYIADERSAGHLSDAAVYFRDLSDGPMFGINENTEYAPASLLKLPLAFVYFNNAEQDPSILSQEISVANPLWHFSEHFRSSESVDPTKPHTIEELLRRMLTYSDNNAYGVLQTHLYETGQQGSITQTFLELGFLNPSSIADDTMNVRQYAAIFRLLYNVSYLDPALDEKILGWLAQSPFTQGIASGVPSDVVVAHKFGERFLDNGEKQFHDCGIIYYPGNPYLLCVMTRGTNFDDLVAVVHHVSQTVYAEVDSRRLLAE